jgi:hypothetical protein
MLHGCPNILLDSRFRGNDGVWLYPSKVEVALFVIRPPYT